MGKPKDKLERSAVIVRETDPDKTVKAILSSEEPVPRFFGREVLSHDEGAVDLSRDKGNGLPLLYNHDEFIGRLRNFRLDGSALSADLTFSKHSERAKIVEAQVRDGELDSMSVGYRINEMDDNGDEVRVTDWTLLEASVVPVPADSSAVVTQRKEGDQMPNDNDAGKGSPSQVLDFTESARQARDAGIADGAKAERQRVADINTAFGAFLETSPEVRALHEQCIVSGATVEQAQQGLLRQLSSQAEAIPMISPDYKQAANGGTRSVVEAGEDDLDKFTEGAALSIQGRSPMVTKEQLDAAAKSEFNGWTLIELGREHARRTGAGMLTSREDVIRHMVRANGLAQGNGSFASIVENVATKELLQGFQSAGETYDAWTQPLNLPDFKVSSLINLSQVPDLISVKETGEYKRGELGDIKETIQLETYGLIIGLTRQVIINDDTGAFTRIPNNAGRAAARKVGDLVYSVLTTNAALLQDATALFDAATHNNLITAGGPPTVERVEVGRVAMKTQTDSKSINAAINPGYLIVPVALGGTSRTLMAAEYDPAGTAGTLTPNSVRDMMTVIEERRLDTDSAVKWYMAADNHPTVIVGYLNGRREPFLDSQDGWSTDGVEWKVRLDVAATAADYRGLWQNDGA